MMLIEAKKAESEEQMAEACEEALAQIESRGYARNAEPGYEKVVCYGIAFFRKSARIRKR